MPRLLLLCVCVLGFGLPAGAQPGWEVGAWAGGSYYFGDLNTQFNLSLPGLAGGAAGRYLFNERIAVAGSLGIAYFRADDRLSSNVFERARNLSFRSSLAELALQAEFNFLPYRHGDYDKYFTPYLLAGLSALYFVPEAYYRGDWVDLAPLRTEGVRYSQFTGALLFGGGVKVDLSYRWSLNLELASRIAFTDYLDDVSDVYPDPSQLGDSDLAPRLSDRSGEVDPNTLPPNFDPTGIGDPGKQRGERSNNDNFLFLKVGVMYYFGQVRCPAVGSGK